MRDSSCERRHRSAWVVENGHARCNICRENRGWVGGETAVPSEATPVPVPPPASASGVEPVVSAPAPAPSTPIDVSFADGIRGDRVPNVPVGRPAKVKVASTDVAEAPPVKVLKPKRGV